MDPLTISLIAAVIPAVTGLIGGLMSNHQAKKNRDAQQEVNEQNQANFERQQDFTEEQTALNNERNTAAWKMQDFKDAGVNPATALMAGSGITPGGTPVTAGMGSLPQMQSTESMTPEVMNAFTESFTGLSGITETALLLGDKKRLMQAQTAQVNQTCVQLGLDNIRSSATMQESIDYARLQNGDMRVSIEVKQAQKGLDLATIDKVHQETQKFKIECEKVLPQQIVESVARTGESYANQSAILESINKMKIEESVLREQEQVYRSQGRLNESLTEQIDIDNEVSRLYKQDTANAYLDTLHSSIKQTEAITNKTNKEAKWVWFDSVTSGIGNVAKAIK